MYLALDQSPSRVGWARGGPQMSAPETGLLFLPKFGDQHAILMDLTWDFVRSQIIEHGVTKVGFEAPYMGANPKNHRDACAQVAAIEWGCSRRDVACVEYTNGQWRKRFIGTTRGPYEPDRSLKGKRLEAAKRRASAENRAWLKRRSIEECEKRGWPIYLDGKPSDDIAEACGMLDYLLSLDFPEYGATAGAPLFA